MASVCREQQVRVEEEVVQKVDRYEKQQRERCENTECNPWLLCLNQLVCWLYWVTVKITEWVVILVVRWVYRIVCVTVSLVIGVLALLILRTDIFIAALEDLVELVADVIYTAIGAILLPGNALIDLILTTLNIKDKARGLTKEEIAVLRPVFGDSLAYGMIRINEGRIGIMGPPFAGTRGATTVGYRIYFRSYNIVTLVHECVHVWQFQFGATRYIGQSVVFQGIHALGGDDPYDWFAQIGTDVNGWYLMNNVEAQAEFIEDLFNFGHFIASDGTTDDSTGAFFRQDDGGSNEFLYGLDSSGGETTDPGDGAMDFTLAANAAWAILKSG